MGERQDADRGSEEIGEPADASSSSARTDDAPPDDEVAGLDEATEAIGGTHEIEPGRILDARYRVEALLGQGAVGLVFKCRHLVLDKDVAIKVLRPDFARDAEVAERFVVEARAASAIGSPHIVDTIDFGRLADGSAYFVMEYLEGASLAELMRDRGSLPAADILHIAIQITSALETAHGAGIIHRDLKPDNVFIVRRGDDDRFVKILDFGIVKLARAESKLTRAGQIYGTPHYMSPEQASGRDTDLRTDVYALGVILFEMVTGNVPFDADEPLAVLTQHLHEEPPEVYSVDHEGFDTVIHKCLAKDPAERYESMTALRDDLARLRGGDAPAALPALRPPLARDHERLQPSSMVGAAYFFAVAGVVVSLALGYALYVRERRDDAARQSQAMLAAASSMLPAPSASIAEVEQPEGRPVVVVVIPAEAKVLQGRRDLGPMPVTVNVPEGETVQLSLLHPGFVSRRLTLDGSRPRVVVGLIPEEKSGTKERSSPSTEEAADRAAAESLDRVDPNPIEDGESLLDPSKRREERAPPRSSPLDFSGLGSPEAPTGPR